MGKTKAKLHLGMLRNPNEGWGMLRNAKKYYGILRNAKGFYGILRNGKKFYGMPNAMECYEIVWNVRMVILWNTKEHHGML